MLSGANPKAFSKYEYLYTKYPHAFRHHWLSSTIDRLSLIPISVVMGGAFLVLGLIASSLKNEARTYLAIAAFTPLFVILFVYGLLKISAKVQAKEWRTILLELSQDDREELALILRDYYKLVDGEVWYKTVTFSDRYVKDIPHNYARNLLSDNDGDIIDALLFSFDIGYPTFTESVTFLEKAYRRREELNDNRDQTELLDQKLQAL